MRSRATILSAMMTSSTSIARVTQMMSHSVVASQNNNSFELNEKIAKFSSRLRNLRIKHELCQILMTLD